MIMLPLFCVVRAIKRRITSNINYTFIDTKDKSSSPTLFIVEPKIHTVLNTFYAKIIDGLKLYIKKVSHNRDTLNIGVKRRDSNPRDFEKSIRFSDERLKPLGHPSTILLNILYR